VQFGIYGVVDFDGPSELVVFAKGDGLEQIEPIAAAGAAEGGHKGQERDGEPIERNLAGERGFVQELPGVATHIFARLARRKRRSERLRKR